MSHQACTEYCEKQGGADVQKRECGGFEEPAKKSLFISLRKEISVHRRFNEEQEDQQGDAENMGRSVLNPHSADKPVLLFKPVVFLLRIIERFA
ncbi:hypothetical protein X733_29470 [Mesorhizobium sp. L2C067A000]|nr:hypothetical protein X733_29470 [Mesorhizobium sp. L2C067A000]